MSRLFLNARIYPAPGMRPVEAMLVSSSGRVVALGEAVWLRASADEVIDLQGATVLPGFTDCHVHLASWARELRGPRLETLTSLAAVVRAVGSAARQSGGGWVTGGGWDANLWPAGERPTRQALDAVAPDTPVAIHSKDWHSLWVNTAAMRLFELGPATADVPGGIIEREPDGHPTGLLFEAAAWRFAEAIPELTPAQFHEVFRLAQHELHRLGFTGIHVVDAIPSFAAIQEFRKADALRLRTTYYLPAARLPALIEAGIRSGLGDRWLAIGGIKAFVDGSLGSQTAWMLEPYEGTRDRRGVLISDEETIAGTVERAAAHGLACAVHAIGDAAVDMVARVFQQANARHGRLRHRIEHCQLATPATVAAIGHEGLIASVQPGHCPADLDILARHWGERARNAYPFRSLLRAGATLVLGSDAPVEPPGVLTTLQAALTRQRIPPDREPFFPEESLTLDQAVRAFALDAAVATGDDGWRGSLEPGKVADFVCFSEDPYRVAAHDLHRIQVVATYLDGKAEYRIG